MKTYLNRADREHHVTILVLWDYLNNWLEKTNCLTVEERKRIKTAATHLLHASDSIIERLDSDYARTLLRAAKDTQIRMSSKTSSVQDGANTVNVSIDDLYDMSCYALTECKNCKRQDHKNCEKYQLFLRLDIPPAQEETDGCPYEN